MVVSGNMSLTTASPRAYEPISEELQVITMRVQTLVLKNSEGEFGSAL